MYWSSNASGATCELLTPSFARSENAVLQQQEYRAQQILRESSPNLFILIFTIFPFRTSSTHLDIYSQRWGILSPFQLYQIQGQTAPYPQTSSVWDWDWFQPDLLSKDADVLADDFDNHFSAAFSKVPFLALATAALGIQSGPVTDLLKGVNNVRLELCRRFQENRQSKKKQQAVAKLLRPRNSLAYWAFSTSIESANDSLDPSDALAFIYDPVQNLFKDLLPFLSLLERLNGLKALYHHTPGGYYAR